VHSRRTARRRFRLHVDAVQKVVERPLVDCHARRVPLDLGNPERAFVQTLVEQANPGAVEEQ
jgi:hypothetical protein